MIESSANSENLSPHKKVSESSSHYKKTINFKVAENARALCQVVLVLSSLYSPKSSAVASTDQVLDHVQQFKERANLLFRSFIDLLVDIGICRILQEKLSTFMKDINNAITVIPSIFSGS